MSGNGRWTFENDWNQAKKPCFRSRHISFKTAASFVPPQRFSHWNVPSRSYLKFVRGSDTAFRLHTGGEEWRALRTSIKLRNRLAHPKELKDMEVTSDEMAMVATAADWFGKQTLDLFTEIVEAGRTAHRLDPSACS